MTGLALFIELLPRYAFTSERIARFEFGFEKLRRTSAVNKTVSEDVRFRVLRLLEDKPNLSQREIAQELGISLGGVNYCLKGLAQKGQIKIRNFRASNNKLRYAYVLTPSGIAARVALTRRFLQRKMSEFEALKAEIEALQQDVNDET